MRCPSNRGTVLSVLVLLAAVLARIVGEVNMRLLSLGALVLGSLAVGVSDRGPGDSVGAS